MSNPNADTQRSADNRTGRIEATIYPTDMVEVNNRLSNEILDAAMIEYNAAGRDINVFIDYLKRRGVDPKDYMKKLLDALNLRK